MPYVITADNLICEISSNIESKEDGLHVKDKGYIIKHSASFYGIGTIPEDVQPYTHCYTPDKGFYLYVDPQPEPVKKSDIEILEEENAMLQMSVMELSTYSALQDERLKGQEQVILELSMLVAGGGA